MERSRVLWSVPIRGGPSRRTGAAWTRPLNAAVFGPASASGFPARRSSPAVGLAAAGGQRVGHLAQLVLAEPLLVAVGGVAEAVGQPLAARRRLHVPGRQLREDHVAVADVVAVARLVL